MMTRSPLELSVDVRRVDYDKDHDLFVYEGMVYINDIPTYCSARATVSYSAHASALINLHERLVNEAAKAFVEAIRPKKEEE